MERRFDSRYRLGRWCQSFAAIAFTAVLLSPVSGFGVDTPDTLRSPSNDADYIIITTDSLYNCIYPLAVHREQADLRVDMVYLTLIEQEFGGTSADTAIRDFVDYAYHNWVPPAPRYVLLNGDVELIPTHFLEVGSYMWPSDNWLVCVEGGDEYPDLAVGRFPGNTPYETVVMTAKTISYEQSPVPGGWHSDILLVADDGAPGAPVRIFEDFCEDIAANYIPPGYHASRVYLRPQSRYYGGEEELRAEIDEGCLLVNYVGHSSYLRWAHETVLSVWSIGSLSNDSKLPIVFAMGQDQDFTSSYSDGMCEVFLTVEGRGAVAHWAPTGLTGAVALAALGWDFYSLFFEASTLGDLLLEAMLGTSPGLVLQMALMGDPALEISFPTGVEHEPPQIPCWPSSVSLSISPNPFWRAARIDYRLLSSAHCSVTVYDLGGRLVRTLVDEYRNPGYHAVVWMGRDDFGDSVAEGVYFVSLRVEGSALTRKVIRLR